MEIDEIQRQVDAALDGTTGYDDSVSRLENIGMDGSSAAFIAAARHGLPAGDVIEVESQVAAGRHGAED